MAVERIYARSHWEGYCLIWDGAKLPTGYGQISINGKRQFVHRVMLTSAVGHGFPGAYALHSCDNPSCVNPSHLRWGTARDNILDAIDRGRASGPPPTTRAANPHTKLTAEQAESLKAELLAGGRPSATARKFGVSTSWVSAQRKLLGLPRLKALTL